MLERINDIQDSLGLYLFAKDNNLRYIYCNELFSQGLGLQFPDEIIGKNDYEFFSRKTADCYRNGDLFVINGGRFINIQEEHPELKRVIQMNVSKRLLRNQQGEFIGVVGSALEVPCNSLKTDHDELLSHFAKNNYRFQIEDRTEHFTTREFQVYKFILDGSTAKQIAIKLGLSHRTVEDYTNRVREKLNCYSKYDIRERSIEIGILDKPS